MIAHPDHFQGMKTSFAETAHLQRQRPPVPVPSMRLAKGWTGRDGMPLTAPVRPVKTGTVGSPTIPALFSSGFYRPSLRTGRKKVGGRKATLIPPVSPHKQHSLFLDFPFVFRLT
jgi:hypothetical protein